LVLAAAAAVVALAGCGSSKPAYCTDRTNLQNSVKGLTSSGVSGLKSQINQIQTDATTLVNSAKGDFPSQTSAITSSVSALKNSLAALPSSPSAAQVVTVTKDAASVVSSVKSFTDASSSKCS
jgi:conjugal transfer/entry exclusion protein